VQHALTVDQDVEASQSKLRLVSTTVPVLAELFSTLARRHTSVRGDKNCAAAGFKAGWKLETTAASFL